MAEPSQPEETSGASKEPEQSPEEKARTEPEGEEVGVDAGMLDHVQMVTSLIEGREVDREEVLEMLRKVLRQHSIVGKGEIAEAIRKLLEAPP